MRAGSPVGSGMGLSRREPDQTGGSPISSWHGQFRGHKAERGHVSTPPGGNALSTDFDLMRSVAAAIDTRNEEIRAALQAFIGRMSSVPPSVWGGMAAGRFKDVVQRWNAESTKLHHALHGIAETIRCNEAALRDATDNHALHIGAAAGDL
jgi:WXG100 family type VII secretion target